jgi:hypothetical protein
MERLALDVFGGVLLAGDRDPEAMVRGRIGGRDNHDRGCGQRTFTVARENFSASSARVKQ